MLDAEERIMKDVTEGLGQPLELGGQGRTLLNGNSLRPAAGQRARLFKKQLELEGKKVQIPQKQEEFDIFRDQKGSHCV